MKDPEIRSLVHLPLPFQAAACAGIGAVAALVRARRTDRPALGGAQLFRPGRLLALAGRGLPLRSISREIQGLCTALGSIGAADAAAARVGSGGAVRATFRRAAEIAGSGSLALVGRRASNHELVALRLGRLRLLRDFGQLDFAGIRRTRDSEPVAGCSGFRPRFHPIPAPIAAARSSGSRHRRCGNRPSGWCDWPAAGSLARARRSIDRLPRTVSPRKVDRLRSRLGPSGRRVRRPAGFQPALPTPSRLEPPRYRCRRDGHQVYRPDRFWFYPCGVSVS